ncbi:MAG: methyltransferase domain-containing protein [Alphaproteobacteria bacterium]|nr:methyltransferase domain-containing protein [Alphaproteobacteria bacterium]
MKKPALSSRALAFDVLQAVLRKNQALDETLERHSDLKNLEKRDRAFVHMLVATALRRLGQIDEAVKACLDKPQELKTGAHDLLRLGAAQLLFMDTPPHAAVDTIVELAASSNATAPYKGLINAVLRRLTREGQELLAKQDAARLNTPGWLWLSWRKAYGVARAREIATANLGEALTDITVKEDPAAWAEKLKARLLPTGSLRLDGLTPIPELAGFAEGNWWVQDAAAALPVKLLGDVGGKSVIDLCAAPGGKTMQLAAQGARVTAIDRSAKRLQRLKDNLARLKLDAEIVCCDAAKYAPPEKAAYVLLDAPCSATGTIRRHPDVQRLKTPEDVTRMAALQKQLLERATDEILAPGGTLVYAVCSLQPEEAEQQIDALLESRPALRRLPIEPEESGGLKDFITPAGDLRCLPCFWPEYGGIDGFFAARLGNGS